MKLFRNNKGFSLVEIIVVLAVMAVLAGIAVISYNYVLKTADDTVDKSNARMLGDVVRAGIIDGKLEMKYIAEASGHYPCNTETGDYYQHTGAAFYADMGEYIATRIAPVSVAAKEHISNMDSDGNLRFTFWGNNTTLWISYYNPEGSEEEFTQCYVFEYD